ncbi:TRAP transporter large permease subunit, partial [Planococcus citreus]
MTKDNRDLDVESVSAHEEDKNLNQEVLEKYDVDAKVRKLRSRNIVFAIAAIAIAYSLYHLWVTFNPLPALQARSIHVAVGMGLVFLVYPAFKKQDKTRIPFYDWILFLFSLATAGYLIYEYDAIMTTRGGIPNTLDIIMAIATVVLVLEAARRVTGIILPILALVFLVYPFISHFLWMPDMLMTRPFDLGDIFGQLYLKTEGLYSTAISASLQFIFLFILFGAFLAKSGMGQLFNDLAMALAGSKQGGPAKVAVISSGFMGSINGSAIA